MFKELMGRIRVVLVGDFAFRSQTGLVSSTIGCCMLLCKTLAF